MHWWPRQTPRIGIVGPNRRTTSVEIPASPGEHGPGEMMMWDGRNVSISSYDVASCDGLLAQLAHVAGQVEDKGVVVVDQQDHGHSIKTSRDPSWRRRLRDRDPAPS